MTHSGFPSEFWGGVTPALLWSGESLRNSLWWTCLQNIKIHVFSVLKFSTMIFNLSLLIFSFLFFSLLFNLSVGSICSYISSLQQTLQGLFGMYLLSFPYLFLSKTAKLCSYRIKSYTCIAVGKLLWYRSILQLYVCSKQCSKQRNEAHLSMPNFKMYTFVTLLRTKPPQSTHFLDSTLVNIIQLRILKCSESSLNEGVFHYKFQ